MGGDLGGCRPSSKGEGWLIYGEDAARCESKTVSKALVPANITNSRRQIAQLYDRTEPERPGEDAPADVAHHFLLAICSRPGTGICFKSRGWYPRQINTLDVSRDDKRPAKLYNTVLLHFITTLKANDDVRQQELVRKVLEACPELVSE